MSNKEQIKKLTSLQEDLQEEKDELTALNTKAKTIVTEMKEKFGVKNVKAAEKKLDDMQTEIEETEAQIDKLLEELKEEYDIDLTDEEE